MSDFSISTFNPSFSTQFLDSDRLNLNGFMSEFNYGLTSSISRFLSGTITAGSSFFSSSLSSYYSSYALRSDDVSSSEALALPRAVEPKLFENDSYISDVLVETDLSASDLTINVSSPVLQGDIFVLSNTEPFTSFPLTQAELVQNDLENSEFLDVLENSFVVSTDSAITDGTVMNVLNNAQLMLEDVDLPEGFELYSSDDGLEIIAYIDTDLIDNAAIQADMPALNIDDLLFDGHMSSSLHQEPLEFSGGHVISANGTIDLDAVLETGSSYDAAYVEPADTVMAVTPHVISYNADDVSETAASLFALADAILL